MLKSLKEEWKNAAYFRGILIAIESANNISLYYRLEYFEGER
jgi:hypothetical protein